MKNRTFDRLFYPLLAGGLVLGALGSTGVLSHSTFSIVILVLAGSMMLFLVTSGGRKAKTGVLVVLLVAVLCAVPGLSPTRAGGDFYSAASQIIPVLLLALALEVRLFRIRWPPRVKRHRNESWLSHQRRQIEKHPSSFVTVAVLFVTLFTLVAGELHALNALAGLHPERQKPWTAYTAVAVGLIIVAFIALFGGLQTEESEDASAST
jgi:hypothetical protein